MPSLVSPDVIWAEPSGMWSPHCMTSCAVWWQCTLLKLACWPLLWCHTFIVFFCQKKSIFVWLLCQPPASRHALVDDVSLQYSYPPAIGPTLGARFFVVVGVTTPCIGVAHALGLRWWTENKTLWLMLQWYLFWIRVWSLIALKVGNLYKRALQWMTTGVEQRQWTMTIK